MASGSAGIDTDLQALLNWVPWRLKSAPGGTHTKATRKPSFYDKHLGDRVFLKNVKSMPSLISDIAATVDRALKNIRDGGGSLPPFSEFMSAKALRTSALQLNKEMVNELSVIQQYTMSIAAYCAVPASLLALYPDLKTWNAVFGWTMTPFVRGYGIPGGAFQILQREELEDYGDGDERNYEGQTSQEVWNSLGAMEGSLGAVREKFPDLAIWEFKSLSAGDEVVMQGIEREASTDTPFEWRTCKGQKYCEPRKHVISNSYVGPDANTTPWTFQPPVSYGTRGKDDTSGPSGTPSKDNTSGSSSTAPPQPKRRKLDNDETYKSADEFTAGSFLQQVWASAVRTDATLIIINSGNYEYVAVRHRGSQTLYVSDLFQPHALRDPGYGKLHIGIYMTAFTDALDRFNKLELDDASNRGENQTGGGGDKKGWGRDQGGRGGKKRGNRDGRGQEPLRRSARHAKGRKRMTENTITQTMQLFSGLKWLSLYLRFAVYDSPVPATFVRVTPSTSAKNFSLTPPDEHMTLVLSSELGEGATGVVHGGQLEVETPKHVTLDVVAKLAFSEEQQESLKHEYSIYCFLASKGVKHIPTALGLFEDVEGGALALVLTPAGAPIAKGQISTAARQDFQVALAGIHHAGVLHGDIRCQNLLINDSGEVAIIDFDRSRKTSSSKAKAREMRHLMDLLDDGSSNSAGTLG